MKFLKKYYGADLRSLLKLYERDYYNPDFRKISYEDINTGAKAVAL